MSKEGTDNFRDTIATVDAAGRRRWLFPRQPEGRMYRRRSWVSYGLLAVLFALPWIKVGGAPLVLLNVLERRFLLFGLSFTPQDFHLFAILMITAVVFIILFTVVFGRLFCGWVCPQTIFMELVFRKIEYWVEGNHNAQRKLAAAPWTADKWRKRLTKHLLFLLVSAAIAHTFLAYIIGTDALLVTVSQSPLAAPSGFLAIIAFIGVFYFVFARMREQVCITICPYGRLQGVMLDEDSTNVIYDYERGEPRGKVRKGQARKSSCSDCADCQTGRGSCGDQMLHRMETALAAAGKGKLGDCVDCGLCVQVCPTGIDIRDGVQMECINCTACIDACDAVMDKLDRPRGLIRYDSERGVREGNRRQFTPRSAAYSAVLLALIGLNIVLLSRRTGCDVLLLRTPGTLYQKATDGTISNLYTYQIVNKTGRPQPLSLEVVAPAGARLRLVGTAPVAPVGQVTKGAIFVDFPPGELPADRVTVRIRCGDLPAQETLISFLHP